MLPIVHVTHCDGDHASYDSHCRRGTECEPESEFEHVMLPANERGN